MRVSTQNQSLGLDAQSEAIKRFIQSDDTILATYVEKDSGKNNNRVELTKAIEYAKKHDATLLIAKLDRLSRNLHFITSLMESKVPFKCCDMPFMDNFTISIIAAVAQREVEMVKERTTAALAVIKNNIDTNGFHISKKGNRITKLGQSEFKKEYWQRGQDAIQERVAANPNLMKAKAFALSLKASGKNGQQITALLNEHGFKTSTGKEYYHTQTMRLLKG